MRWLRAAGAFAADFVVGDDPVVALVVVVALGATALAADAGLAAWWILPPAVLGALALSVWRAAGRGDLAPRGPSTPSARSAPSAPGRPGSRRP